MEQAPKDHRQTKQEEQGPSPQKTLLESLSNPLSLVVVGAFLTLITTIVTSYLAQRATREAARQELQSELIKKFVDVPKTDTIRANLRFLIEAGLLPDYAGNIEAYLDANPNAAPQLTQGVVGNDQRTPLESLDLSKQADFRGVGLVRITLGPGAQTLCTGFLVAPDVVLTGQCGTELSPDNPEAKSRIGSFELFSAGRSDNAWVNIEKSRIATVKSGDLDVVLIGLKPSDASRDYIPLAPNAPAEGQQFAMAFYAIDKKHFMYSADSGCQIISVEDRELRHLCDTGAGAGGGPMVTPEGAVIGVHMSNAPDTKRAIRADVIRKDPTVIKVFGALPTS
jgi:V8-like Glu-specific endopeptidase